MTYLQQAIFPAAGTISWTGRSVISSPADSAILLTNAAGNAFTYLYLGGTTSSFPVVKRNSTTIEARLADDSAYTALRGSRIMFTNGSFIQDNSDGVAQLSNAAGTDFGRLQFGGTTSSFPALKRNGATIQARLGDDSADANFSALGFQRSGVVMISGTAPSAPASCGTSPAVTSSNGSVTFLITGGTGGTATGCTVTMPTAPAGWNCHVTNITQTAAHRADRTTVQIASTTTSVQWEYQTVSTGAATAFTASDVFRGICFPY